jgi:hypothetical protein
MKPKKNFSELIAERAEQGAISGYEENPPKLEGIEAT